MKSVFCNYMCVLKGSQKLNVFDCRRAQSKNRFWFLKQGFGFDTKHQELPHWKKYQYINRRGSSWNSFSNVVCIKANILLQVDRNIPGNLR